MNMPDKISRSLARVAPKLVHLVRCRLDHQNALVALRLEHSCLENKAVRRADRVNAQRPSLAVLFEDRPQSVTRIAGSRTQRLPCHLTRPLRSTRPHRVLVRATRIRPHRSFSVPVSAELRQGREGTWHCFPLPSVLSHEFHLPGREWLFCSASGRQNWREKHLVFRLRARNSPLRLVARRLPYHSAPWLPLENQSAASRTRRESRLATRGKH